MNEAAPVPPRAWLPPVVLACLAGCGAGNGGAPAPVATAAWSNPPAAEVPVPAAAEPPVQLVVPDLAEYEAPNSILIPGRVFPVGWSPAGLFAYAYEPPDEACGCYFFRLVVQDLSDNQVVWEHEYDSGELEEGNPNQLTSVAAVWHAEGAALSAKLAALGIVRRHEPALHEFAPAGGPQVKILTEEVNEARSSFGFAYLSSYRVAVTWGEDTQIVFHGGPGETGTQVGPLQVSSPGYLRSPYGSRIAVLIQETWRGWEGRPYVARLRFAGADPGQQGKGAAASGP